MADQFPSFEQALEADIRTLAAEIARKGEQNEANKAEGLEVVRDAIRAFPQLKREVPAPAAEHPVPVPTPAPTASQGPLPAYAADASPETKLEIEYLLDLAFREGLSKAFAEAEKSPEFVRDAFHDSLAGKLYPVLQQRGIVR